MDALLVFLLPTKIEIIVHLNLGGIDIHDHFGSEHNRADEVL